MTTIESEIERRITLLKSNPILRDNGWRPSVTCRWLSNEVKIVDITLLTWRSLTVVMTVSRESDDILKAVDKAFTHITKKIEKLHEERNTGMEEGV